MYTLLAKSSFEQFMRYFSRRVFGFMDKPIGDWTVHDIAPFFGLVCVVVGFLVIATVTRIKITQFAEYAEKEREPVIETQAKLIQVEQKINQFGSVCEYLCTFKCENGQQPRFRIPESAWKGYAEGDTGTLVFQGAELKWFTLNRDNARFGR
jgi:hypothetical protein